MIVLCIPYTRTRNCSFSLSQCSFVSHATTMSFAAHRKCTLNRDENRDFQALRSNRINVTCECHQRGHEWSSRFGLCVDVNECTRGMHNCILDAGENCFNLLGSYTCICRLGYIYNPEVKQCVYSPDFDRMLKGDASEPKVAKTKSLLDTVVRTITRSAGDCSAKARHIYTSLIFIALMYGDMIVGILDLTCLVL